MHAPGNGLLIGDDEIIGRFPGTLHPYESDFDLHGNEQTEHVCVNIYEWFTRRIVSPQRQKATRKWPIFCKRCVFGFVLAIANFKTSGTRYLWDDVRNSLVIRSPAENDKVKLREVSWFGSRVNHDGFHNAIHAQFQKDIY